MRHSMPVAWHNVEIFLIKPADRGGLYPMLPDWWVGYDFSYLLFVYTPLVFSYYGGLYCAAVPTIYGG